MDIFKHAIRGSEELDELRERAEKIIDLYKQMTTTFKEDEEYLIIAIMAGLIDYRNDKK